MRVAVVWCCVCSRLTAACTRAASRALQSKELKRLGQPSVGPVDEGSPRCVVLLSIFNVHYPITIELIHQITSPCGNVLRIVIFKRNILQVCWRGFTWLSCLVRRGSGWWLLQHPPSADTVLAGRCRCAGHGGV